ncbi:MAG TPA: hypothetical protein VFN67_29595 [Polyangiales bacterium]|nr:hypothetical protein [Polyangiales bacterium]
MTAHSGRIAAQSSQDEIGFGPSEPTTSSAAVSGTDDDVGFGTSNTASSSASSPPPTEPFPLRLHATLRTQGALRTKTAEPSRFAKLRQVVDAKAEFTPSLGAGLRLQMVASVHSEADYAYLRNATRYDSTTMETMAWQVRPDPTFIKLSLSAFEISYGYQIANLGQAEMLSVLDVVNPRDVREPMPTDTNVTHLPVLMTHLGLALSRVRLEAVVVHEPYFGMLPPPLGEFSPFRQLLLDDASIGGALSEHALRNVHIPRRDITNVGAIQPYGKISVSVGALDLTLVGGSTLDRMGYPILPKAAAFELPVIDMPIVHSRYWFVGHGGSLTVGPLLLRWELAFNRERPIAVRQTSGQLLSMMGLRRDQLQGMFGFMYMPSTVTSAALELSQTYIVNSPNRAPASSVQTLFPMEAPQIAVRFNQRFFDERASFSVIGLLIGVSPWNACSARLELGYAISDRIELTAGYVLYAPSQRFGYLYGLTQHDRAFVNLRWEADD